MIKRDEIETFAAHDYVDFVCDASGWGEVSESDWHICATGKVGGRPALVAALVGTHAPAASGALLALVDSMADHDGLPIVLVLTPCQVSSELPLSQLLSRLVRVRKCNPIIAVVLGELVGPVAIMARLADIVCLGPIAGLALADALTSKLVVSPNRDSVSTAGLNRRFPTDAAALFGARHVACKLSLEAQDSSRTYVADREDCVAIERLVGSEPGGRIDERRLLQRIVDDRSFFEFDGSGGLATALTTIAGETVGVMTSSVTLSGALDAAALTQAASFAQFCERRSLPVVALVNSPGVVPDEIALGALADLVAVWEEKRGPVISLVMQEAIGAAAAALVPFRSRVLSWPGATTGLLRGKATAPAGQMIPVRSSRQALIRTLASLKEVAV